MRSLRRQGHPEDRAGEAFHDAVVVLYQKCPNKVTRREVNHFLRQVAFQKAKKAARAMAKIDLGVARPDEPEDSTADTTAEVRSAFRASVKALSSLPPRDRRLLLQRLQVELVAMDEAEAADVLQIQIDALGNDEGSAGERRMRLARARQQLRARVRGWLVGVPVIRAWQRDGWSPEVRGVGLAAGAVFVVASAMNIPQQTSSAAPASRRALNPNPAVMSVVGDKAHALRPTRPSAAPQSSHVIGDAGQVPAREHRDNSPPPVAVPRHPATEVSGSRRPSRDNALVCLKNFPVLPDSCVPHPLRRPASDR